MHLTSFIKKELIFLDRSFENVTELIQQIVPTMTQNLHLNKSSDELVELFLAREAQDSTAYPIGIGIPHIRVDNLANPIIAIVVPMNHVLVNKIPLKMFILIITDKIASKLYLNIVKAILTIAKNTKFFDDLCLMTESGSFFDRLHNEEIRVLNEITVADIMSSQFTTIQETANIKELGNLLESTQSDYFPVLNSNNQVTGEVTLFDYLKVGIPKYTLLLENVKFPQTIEPLEDIFRKEDTLTIKEIMTPIIYKVTTASSISEAVFQMAKRQSRYLPIFQDNHLVGIVSINDIFKKVIRG